jgi:hypothetical protein
MQVERHRKKANRANTTLQVKSLPKVDAGAAAFASMLESSLREYHAENENNSDGETPEPSQPLGESRDEVDGTVFGSQTSGPRQQNAVSPPDLGSQVADDPRESDELSTEVRLPVDLVETSNPAVETQNQQVAPETQNQQVAPETQNQQVAPETRATEVSVRKRVPQVRGSARSSKRTKRK